MISSSLLLLNMLQEIGMHDEDYICIEYLKVSYINTIDCSIKYDDTFRGLVEIFVKCMETNIAHD